MDPGSQMTRAERKVVPLVQGGDLAVRRAPSGGVEIGGVEVILVFQ